jgi:cell wall-associated NlpC family hydrolase
MYASGQAIAKGAIGPGDLVFFRTNGTDVAHVGIMVDDRRFIHSSTSRGVMISPLTDAYWAPRFIGARRVLFDR